MSKGIVRFTTEFHTDEKPLARMTERTLRSIAAETLARGGPSNSTGEIVGIGELDGITVLVVRGSGGPLELQSRPDLAHLLAPDAEHPNAVRVIFESNIPFKLSEAQLKSLLSQLSAQSAQAGPGSFLPPNQRNQPHATKDTQAAQSQGD